jgi:hypothetical protein
MALSQKTRNALAIALTSTDSADELIGELLGGNETSKSAAVTPVAVTFTGGGTPATYTTPTGALTIADGTAPTAVELLKYCDELRGNIVALQAVLHAQGITT